MHKLNFGTSGIPLSTIPRDTINGIAAIGEFGLDGSVRRVRGTFAAAAAAQAQGLTLVVPHTCAALAAAGGGYAIATASLADAVAVLRGEREAAEWPAHAPSQDRYPVDFADVLADLAPVVAQLEAAATQGRNVLLVGPPGAGKSMLARRFVTILPPPTAAEHAETVRIWDAAGPLEGMPSPVRPFRAPHHTVSDAGLVGGGVIPRPGEVSLAHNGVLFLDELPEFRRGALEALSYALRDGEIVAANRYASARLPARPAAVIAAMNPCPCGWHGVEGAGRSCTCSDDAVARYAARVAAFVKRLNPIVINVPATTAKQIGALTDAGTYCEPSAVIRARVEAARTSKET